MGINDHDYGNDIGPEERKILRQVNQKEQKGLLARIFSQKGKHVGSEPGRYQDQTGWRTPRGPVADIPEKRQLPDE